MAISVEKLQIGRFKTLVTHHSKIEGSIAKDIVLGKMGLSVDMGGLELRSEWIVDWPLWVKIQPLKKEEFRNKCIKFFFKSHSLISLLIISIFFCLSRSLSFHPTLSFSIPVHFPSLSFFPCCFFPSPSLFFSPLFCLYPYIPGQGISCNNWLWRLFCSV